MVIKSGIACIAVMCTLSYPALSESLTGEAVEAGSEEMLLVELTAFQEETGLMQGNLTVYVTTPDECFFATAGPEEGIEENTHFRAASTTKTFTAASIMLLHSQGLLDIDDTVSDIIPGTDIPYLPETPEYAVPYKDQITLRQLLGHRAGVFDVSNDRIPETVDAPYAGQAYIEYVRDITGNDDHTFTFDELVGVVADNSLSYWEPGEGFHYSNTGYSMLGKIIERVSGLSYGEYVSTTFLDPLGLTCTSFPDLGTDMEIPSPYINGYTLFDGQVYPTTVDNMSPHVAEGNVITTPHDLSLWITLLLSGRAGIDMETIDSMTDVSETGEHHIWYGLGTTWTPGLGYGHNGGHIGYMTVVRYEPADSVTVLVFSSFLAPEYLEKQGELLIRVAREARETCGYPAYPTD